MPDITFILPHWIYWGGIAAVPALLMLAARRLPARASAPGGSPLVAYFFWLVGGFVGLHRLYLKSWPAALFIALFVAVIVCNHEARQARNAHSIAKNEAFNADYDLNLAIDEGELNDDALAKLRDDLESKQNEERNELARMENWTRASGIIAAVVLILLLIDATLIPRECKRVRIRDRMQSPEQPPDPLQSPKQPPDPSQPSPLPEERTPPSRPGGGVFARTSDRINSVVGEFAAFWTVIAVFVFYYEVIARYIFNSPTIWAHESMFLLFGMQYLLAGGYCLREGAHVRVDVFYARMSARRRAVADLATSVFFFIFTGSLLATGWIFFSDSFAIGQVSHTEWEIPHWPIKFALPLGGALIILQGAANVLRDIAALRGTGGTGVGTGGNSGGTNGN